MDIDSDSLSVEFSNDSNESKQDTCREECIKKDLKVKHPKEENINSMQDTNRNTKLKHSFESDDIDYVLSGESLYKTFTFEQTSNEDIDKCIAFWTTVMQKNLEPIKCSIIESTENRIPKAKLEKPPLEDDTEEINARIKEAEAKIHAHYKDMWMTVLNEIKKRKLDEIKMYAKSRCKMCETAMPSQDFILNQEDIIQLKNVKPDDNGPALRKQINLKKPDVCICEPILKTENSDSSISTIVSEGRYIRKNTNRYILKDLINQKKKTGAYSHWRNNILKPCSCGADPCECNENPAIVSIDLPAGTCSCKFECQCILKTLNTEVSEKETSCTCVPEKCICKSETPETKSESKTPTVEIITSGTTASIPSLSGDKSSSKSSSTNTFSGENFDYTGLIFRTDRDQLKKDSTADVTKKGSDKGSSITLDMSKCNCVGECQCKKFEVEEEQQSEGGLKHGSEVELKKKRNKSNKRSKK